MSADTEELIRHAAFFRGLSDDACRRLAGVTRRRTLAKRDRLFSEQTQGDAMYLLVKGSVQLLKTSAGGTDIVVRTISRGEVFAEVVLFETDRYPVTAVALMASEVLTLRRALVRDLLAEPAFRDDFIAMLMRKQRYLAERVRCLSSCDVEERFFIFLREHYGGATRIELDMARKDLAAAIGATPETLSRLMRRLVREGRLREEGPVLVVDGREFTGAS